jgi:hypothetical protein
MGPIERNIAQQAYRSGEPMPDRIANAPELDLGLEVYLQAFFDLDSERSHGMGLMPIPFTAVLQYARLYDFDEEQTEDLLYFIRRMDNANLARLDKKANKK